MELIKARHLPAGELVRKTGSKKTRLIPPAPALAGTFAIVGAILAGVALGVTLKAAYYPTIRAAVFFASIAGAWAIAGRLQKWWGLLLSAATLAVGILHVAGRFSRDGWQPWNGCAVVCLIIAAWCAFTPKADDGEDG